MMAVRQSEQRRSWWPVNDFSVVALGGRDRHWAAGAAGRATFGSQRRLPATTVPVDPHTLVLTDARGRAANESFGSVCIERRAPAACTWRPGAA